MKTKAIDPKTGALSPKKCAFPVDQSARPEFQTLVYLVDDDETTRALAGTALADGEFRVCVFADAASALERMRQEPPDVVVVDVLMPEMNGFEFCASVRRQAQWSDIPVLMVTILDDPKSIDQAYEVGATGFIVKPVNWELEKYRLRYMMRAAEVTRKLRQKETETRQAKEQWERTFNAIKDLVMILDKDLKIVRCNSATVRLIGQPTEQMLGKSCHDLFHDSASPCIDCAAQRVFATGEPQSQEIASKSNPGRVMQIDSAPICDNENRVVSVLCVARDISEQRNLEAQCRQAQKMEAIGTLCAGVAHEFNNLLQVILGYAGALARLAGSSEEAASTHQVLVDAAMRGGSLTRQLLGFSRKSLGQSIRWPLDLNPLVRDSKAMLCRLLPKNIKIETQLAADLGRVSADSTLLRQILVNMALNSAQAMPGGGRLLIQTRNIRLDNEFCHYNPELKPGEYVELSVADTGCGMDAQTLERIYEPFFTTKKSGQGTGLGLSIVFSIVRQHGGGIVCASQPGQGTTFRIFLPLYVKGEPAPAPAPRSQANKHGGGELIMVVDDEHSIRRTVASELENNGYTVLSVPDGEIAVDTYREARVRPNLVLLDLGMPGITGWECLKRLRAIDPAIKVLLATGYGDEQTARTAQLEGAAGVVCKPFEMATLNEQIRMIFDG